MIAGDRTVLKKYIPEMISLKGTAHYFINILVAIIVHISKCNPMSLLNVPCIGGICNILKFFSSQVVVKFIGNNTGKWWPAGTQVIIKPSIIINISKIAAHGKIHVINTVFFAHISKCIIAIVVVKAWKI